MKVLDLVKSGDTEAVADAVLALDAAGRKEVAARLPGLPEEMTAESGWGWLHGGQTPALLVAGAGTIGGAAAVASWLGHRDLQVIPTGGWTSLTGPLQRVLAARPAQWRTDLVDRLAARFTPGAPPWQQPAAWQITAALVRADGGPVPLNDGFVLGWTIRDQGRLPLADDPFLDAMLPRLFEVDGVGRTFAGNGRLRDWQGSWDGELARLAAAGRIRRAALLDGCLSRFLRGGTPHDLRFFVKLHVRLEPTAQEAAERVRDYVRLLPAAPPGVAELALRAVRQVDEAGALETSLFAEAAGALLFRPEKKLVNAALGWLDRAARGREDAVLGALTVAFGHESLDAQERAARIVVKHAARAGAETRAAVRDAAGALPATAREQIAAAIGQVAAVSTALPALPPAPVPSELPPPISSVAELAAEVTAQLHGGTWAGGERVLAGLAAFAHREPAATREAVRKVIADTAPWLADRRSGLNEDPGTWIGTALQALVPPREEARPRPFPHRDLGPGPCRALIKRMREIAGLLGEAPVLLATPTLSTGHLAPDVLLERLSLLEKAGAEPGALDLEQALLRLPREIDPATADRFRGLASPAGRAAAEWLASGCLPDPQVTLVGRGDAPEEHRLFPAITTAAPPAPGSLVDDLFGHLQRTYFDLTTIGWWPSLLPSHREVIAAQILLSLPMYVDDRSGQGALATALAEADGPAGAATAAVLALTLGSRHTEERNGAVDALLILAARGALPAAELGTAIADREQLMLNRLAGPLGQAVDAGAAAEVLTALAAALPRLLARPATGLPDLLSVATRAAGMIGHRPDIPGLAEVAARGGSSRLVREARRLKEALA
ncbi:DUF6493 family protein [Actinomadura macrotermitis]|uniref:DUF6493 domain-containing protein n=1 Tax=Actinomadura macrotermitis TaxID=2585200 RepID=A0A7K0C341_9ACTN|nr:DUF6493 family protein [Actinomadura macrotermitis]MQY07786.1 hypothetical protein [Actinomadura macrotermitis]